MRKMKEWIGLLAGLLGCIGVMLAGYRRSSAFFSQTTRPVEASTTIAACAVISGSPPSPAAMGSCIVSRQATMNSDAILCQNFTISISLITKKQNKIRLSFWKAFLVYHVIGFCA